MINNKLRISCAYTELPWDRIKLCLLYLHSIYTMIKCFLRWNYFYGWTKNHTITWLLHVINYQFITNKVVKHKKCFQTFGCLELHENGCVGLTISLCIAKVLFRAHFSIWIFFVPTQWRRTIAARLRGPEKDRSLEPSSNVDLMSRT